MSRTNLTRRQWSTLLDRAGDEPTFGEVVATVEEADMIATNDAEQLVWDALSMLVLDQNMDTKTIVLGEGPVSPDDRREYDRFGNPIPSPTDVCDFCGTLRYDRPEGFSPEIMTPFGEAEYLCKSCREQGRGMK